MRSTDPTRNRSSQGFTLIEVTIALGIFAFGMVTLSAMQVFAMHGRSSGRHMTQAFALAESQMELFQRQPWDDVAVTTGFDTPVTLNPESEVTYSVDWRITDLVTDWTRTIDVRVQWDEPNRPGRSLVITSVRFNRDAV